jgi:hypothetical protein
MTLAATDHTRIRGTVIGSTQAGHGNLMSLHGFGTTWESHGVVELIGSSALQVSDGASVVCPSLFLRDSRTSLLVRGAGTRLHVAGRMESRGGALLIIDSAEVISGDGAIGFSGNTGDPPPALSVLSGDGTMWQCRSNLCGPPIHRLGAVSPGQAQRFRFRRFLEHSHDRVKRRLGLALAIEEQRMIDASPRKPVQPALAIVQVPEGNAADHV